MPRSTRIEKLYSDVPQEDIAELLRFRESHPLKHLAAGKIEVAYMDTEQDKPALLILPGALSLAESSFRTINVLENDYRIITLDYPPVPTMSGLCDGLAEILDAVGIDRINVVGGSYGGLVAQAFVRLYPDRVKRLILTHTTLFDEESGRALKKALRWLPLVPEGMLKAITTKSLGGLLKDDMPHAAFMHAYMHEVFRYRLTKKDILGLYRRTLDLVTGYRFAPGDLAEWPGRVLIITADDDPGLPEPLREQLLALYPGAELRLFHGTGHASSLLRPDEFYEAIRAFLNQP